MAKIVLNSPNAPKAVGPYVQGIEAGGFVFCSGALGINPAEGKLVDGVEAQAKQMMENMAAVLKEAGLTYSDVVKTTIFLTDMGDFGKINPIYASYFEEGNYPARSCIAVAALPLGGLIEMEVIAAKK